MAEFVRSGRAFQIWNYDPSHRQLIIRSDPSRLDGTTTRVEVYFGHVEFMLVRPTYHSLRVRLAPPVEFRRISEFAGIPAEDSDSTYLIDPEGMSFVVSGRPSWREAVRRRNDPALFDFSEEWPPSYEAQWGSVEE
ncbi:hypothetical protein [Streptomyces xylophagus]|uniref:hypothetical protein n=1 Tax=Streptomyces xylophagus TaxID=285514 RepID=UPI0005B887B8|nr:hypothetical protein [Streptomyces xylophagus]